MTAAYLLSLTVLSILLLLLLIIYYRMQAFIALLVVSLLVAVAGGIPVGEIIDTIQEGMGSILGYIAVVVGIGTMVGEILLVSGGAKQIAGTLLSRSGEKRAPQALALIGYAESRIPELIRRVVIRFVLYIRGHAQMNFSADITTPYDTSCKCRGYSGNDSNKYDPAQIGTQKRCDSYRARSRRNKGVSHCNTCCLDVIYRASFYSPSHLMPDRFSLPRNSAWFYKGTGSGDCH